VPFELEEFEKKSSPIIAVPQATVQPALIPNPANRSQDFPAISILQRNSSGGKRKPDLRTPTRAATEANSSNIKENIDSSNDSPKSNNEIPAQPQFVDSPKSNNQSRSSYAEACTPSEPKQQLAAAVTPVRSTKRSKQSPPTPITDSTSLQNITNSIAQQFEQMRLSFVAEFKILHNSIHVQSMRLDHIERNSVYTAQELVRACASSYSWA
jgi:hypothetical protein